MAMKRILLLLSLTVLALSANSCDPFNLDVPEPPFKSNVTILYSVGYNDLSSSLRNDIDDVAEGYLPGVNDRNVMLVVAHHSVSNGDFTTPVNPCIIRLYESGGAAVRDTVYVMDSSVDTLTTVAGMRKALTFIKEKYPSKSYGMVFSSHATGWMPAGAYDKLKSRDDDILFAARPYGHGGDTFTPGCSFSAEYYHEPGVKSIGETAYRTVSGVFTRSLEIYQFAEALPMFFDYIVFDACLAGGIEFAWQLRGRCGLFCASQTEILTDGFDYTKLGERLLKGADPDPVGFCADFYEFYNKRTGTGKSATVSVIDCRKLQPLAAYSKFLFTKYRYEMEHVDPTSIQAYFRSGHHWFYDFEDILIKSGINSQEQGVLSGYLGECLVYKAATPQFFGSLEIKHHSGLSMFLPCDGVSMLHDFYRTLAWNEETGLVK